jgi:hypothetical protein
VHKPVVQVEPYAEQLLPHAPQLSFAVKLCSQPVLASLSQSPKPVLQAVILHFMSSQITVSLLPLQLVLQEPQLVTRFKFVSQVDGSPSQLPVPVGQALLAPASPAALELAPLSPATAPVAPLPVPPLPTAPAVPPVAPLLVPPRLVLPPVALVPPAASPASPPDAPASKATRAFFVVLSELHDCERTTTPAPRANPKYFFTRMDYRASDSHTRCARARSGAAGARRCDAFTV